MSEMKKDGAALAGTVVGVILVFCLGSILLAGTAKFILWML